MRSRGEALCRIHDEKGRSHLWYYQDGLWTLLLEPAEWLEHAIEVMLRLMNKAHKSKVKFITEVRKYIERSPDIRVPGKISWDDHGKVPTRSGLIDPGHARDRAVSEGALRDLAPRPGLRPSRHLSAMGGIARGLLRRGSGRGARKAHHAAAGLFGHHPDRPATEGAEARPGAARRQRHRQEHPAAGAVGDADGYADLDVAGGYLRPARPGGIPASRTVGARRSLRYRRLASQQQGQGDHLPRASQHQPEEPSPCSRSRSTRRRYGAPTTRPRSRRTPRRWSTAC